MITPESLQIVSAISLFSFGLVLAAGFLMGISPAAFPVWSAVTGYVLGGEKQDRRHAFTLALAFVLGIATVYTAFGVLFVVAGQVLQVAFKFVASRLPLWNSLIGLLLLIIGLHMAHIRRFRAPALTRPIFRRAETPGGAYLLGIPFGLAACPSCTPMLLAILVAAGATGQVWYGASLVFVFSIGFGIPLLAVATAAHAATQMERWVQYGAQIERWA
ncbi:MAG: cytochrome c biogenesis CcdA family protein, partial [Anaerolineae bacterium]